MRVILLLNSNKPTMQYPLQAVRQLRWMLSYRETMKTWLIGISATDGNAQIWFQHNCVQTLIKVWSV